MELNKLFVKPIYSSLLIHKQMFAKTHIHYTLAIFGIWSLSGIELNGLVVCMLYVLYKEKKEIGLITVPRQHLVWNNAHFD